MPTNYAHTRTGRIQQNGVVGFTIPPRRGFSCVRSPADGRWRPADTGLPALFANALRNDPGHPDAGHPEPIGAPFCRLVPHKHPEPAHRSVVPDVRGHLRRTILYRQQSSSQPGSVATGTLSGKHKVASLQLTPRLCKPCAASASR